MLSAADIDKHIMTTYFNLSWGSKPTKMNKKY
jgi:hypothetical protein